MAMVGNGNGHFTLDAEIVGWAWSAGRWHAQISAKALPAAAHKVLSLDSQPCGSLCQGHPKKGPQLGQG